MTEPDDKAKQELDQLIKDFAAPKYNVFYPEDVWNEVLPGLFLGGTDTPDDLSAPTPGSGAFGMPETQVNKQNFDTVVTLYAWARPADWFVKELRLGILDGPMTDYNLDDLRNLVVTAHTDWKAGKRVLIRCQAGINRSSLIMALVLIREGLSAKKAIGLMRKQRGMAVLANGHFVDWLTQLDVKAWRA
ncbi:MAG: hypothetical protein RJA35_891 [Actinomycetota bacterium]